MGIPEESKKGMEEYSKKTPKKLHIFKLQKIERARKS